MVKKEKALAIIKRFKFNQQIQNRENKQCTARNNSLRLLSLDGIAIPSWLFIARQHTDARY